LLFWSFSVIEVNKFEVPDGYSCDRTGLGNCFFLMRAFVLNTCSRLDRKEKDFFKDSLNRYGKGKSDMVKPKTLRGTVMILKGKGLYLSDMVLHMMHF
jgi:hypothetical protein